MTNSERAEEFIASMAPANGSIPYAGYGPQYVINLDDLLEGPSATKQ